MNTIEGSSKLAQSIMELIKSYENEAYGKGFKDGKEFESTMQPVPFNKPSVKPKTPNQQRAELIEKAKKFVEEHEKDVREQIQYIVNIEKRTVVVLIKGFVLYRGIAKCHPNDVFNLDIGKAIALGKAKEIDIPVEFLEAVQPSEVVVGIKFQRDDKQIRTVVGFNSSKYPLSHEHSGYTHPSEIEKITDDTNAQYEVVSCKN